VRAKGVKSLDNNVRGPFPASEYPVLIHFTATQNIQPSFLVSLDWMEAVGFCFSQGHLPFRIIIYKRDMVVQVRFPNGYTIIVKPHFPNPQQFNLQSRPKSSVGAIHNFLLLSTTGRRKCKRCGRNESSMEITLTIPHNLLAKSVSCVWLCTMKYLFNAELFQRPN